MTALPYTTPNKNGGSYMLEKGIEARLKNTLQARGALVYKFVSPGQAGVPDRLVVLPGGRCVFVELKQETGQLEALQKWQLDRLRKQGAEVHVVKGREDALALVHRLFPDPAPIKGERSEPRAEDAAQQRRKPEACGPLCEDADRTMEGEADGV